LSARAELIVAGGGTICVFAKPPVPGKVKTRLAAQIGERYAAEFARAFLRDTWAMASTFVGVTPVLATTEAGIEELELSGPPETWLQGNGDLGQRLERVFTRALAKASFVIAIGADTPGLPPHLMRSAIADLATADAVLGPADDGGFYLIGLRRCPAGLFERLPWSMSTTFAAMQERLRAHAMTVSVLEPWFDIDQAEDLERLHSMILSGQVSASETARLLGSALPRLSP
jgi:hypothetical protein